MTAWPASRPQSNAKSSTTAASVRRVGECRGRGLVVEHVVDLGDEQHVAGLVDLVGGHVHVDAGHVTEGEALVGTEAGPSELDVEPLVGEPGREHVGAEGAVHAREPGHREHGGDSTNRKPALPLRPPPVHSLELTATKRVRPPSASEAPRSERSE